MVTANEWSCWRRRQRRRWDGTTPSSLLSVTFISMYLYQLHQLNWSSTHVVLSGVDRGHDMPPLRPPTGNERERELLNKWTAHQLQPAINRLTAGACTSPHYGQGGGGSAHCCQHWMDGHLVDGAWTTVRLCVTSCKCVDMSMQLCWVKCIEQCWLGLARAIHLTELCS